MIYGYVHVNYEYQDRVTHIFPSTKRFNSVLIVTFKIAVLILKDILVVAYSNKKNIVHLA